jgi:lysophospholipid acyltransferase (LPLAT)-like uncharacterized protein
MNPGILERIIVRWMCSLRFRVAGRVLPPHSFILALPHCSLFVASAYFRDRDMVTMVSRSGDGALIAGVLDGLGYVTVRGSRTSGGGSALREMARLARNHDQFAITVDGSRGPAWRVKPGVIELARLTGLPILPVVAWGPGIRWPSWDRLVVPLPFARCTLRFGEPLHIAREMPREEARLHVETALHALRMEAGL